MAALQAGAPMTVEALRYEAEGLKAGELWRLFSAHLVHLGWRHWLWNASGLGLIILLFTPWLTVERLLVLSLISALSVSLGLLFFSPQVVWYVGLSGVLHGVLVAGGLQELKARRWEGAFVLALVGLKLIGEQHWGPLAASEAGIGGPVLVDAHLYGACGGVLGWLLTVGWRMA